MEAWALPSTSSRGSSASSGLACRAGDAYHLPRVAKAYAFWNMRIHGPFFLNEPSL